MAFSVNNGSKTSAGGADVGNLGNTLVLIIYDKKNRVYIFFCEGKKIGVPPPFLLTLLRRHAESFGFRRLFPSAPLLTEIAETQVFPWFSASAVGADRIADVIALGISAP